MPSLPVYNLEKTKVGTVDLDDTIFAAEVSPTLINRAVRAQIAKRHEFRTANSLTRTEVKGTRKKMYRQKGTGQARHGNATAPIFVGGGKAHGPHPRRVRHRINKQVMRKALISTLSMLQKEDRLFIIDKLTLEKHSTRAVAKSMKSFGLTSALVINPEKEPKEKVFNQSVRNLKQVKTLRPEGVNVFDLLKFKNLLMSEEAVKHVTERLKNV